MILTTCAFAKGNRLKRQGWCCVACFSKVVPCLNAPFVTTCRLTEEPTLKGSVSALWYGSQRYFILSTLILAICGFPKGNHAYRAAVVLCGLLLQGRSLFERTVPNNRQFGQRKPFQGQC
jgi:hypothetical protein